jgi:hypothetical protein
MQWVSSKSTMSIVNYQSCRGFPGSAVNVQRYLLVVYGKEVGTPCHARKLVRTHADWPSE